MNYLTFEPSEDLSPFVKLFWTLESPKEEYPHRQTIVPDGCMEMIFHAGDLYKQYLQDGTSIIQPRCFVIGQLTQPLDIEPTGETHIFAIRFHPNGFLPFTDVSIKEMENKAVLLEDVFGPGVREIEKIILNATTTLQRIECMEAFLVSRLTDRKTIDNVVKETVSAILKASGHLSVTTLSTQANVSRRQLERKFLSTVGLSPKQLSKTIRLQVALNMLINGNFDTLTTLAYENEYYDQAHFVKDFKELTGFTPKEFYGDSLKMSSLFYGKG